MHAPLKTNSFVFEWYYSFIANYQFPQTLWPSSQTAASHPPCAGSSCLRWHCWWTASVRPPCLCLDQKAVGWSNIPPTDPPLWCGAATRSSSVHWMEWWPVGERGGEIGFKILFCLPCQLSSLLWTVCHSSLGFKKTHKQTNHAWKSFHLVIKFQKLFGIQNTTATLYVKCIFLCFMVWSPVNAIQRCCLWKQPSLWRLTVGERTGSDKDNPSRSVTRLLDRNVLTGVTWGDGVGSTEEIKEHLTFGSQTFLHMTVVLWF